MKKILVIAVTLFLFFGCSKNEHLLYTEKRALSFANRSPLTTGDSLVYSFVSNAVQGNRDTLYLPLRLTGDLLTQELPFSLEVAPGSTAQEHVHYEFTPTIFPADTATHNYPIILLRTPELVTETRTLNLSIVANDNFDVGPLSNETAVVRGVVSRRSYETVKLQLTDRLVRPSWWGFAENYYYGSYSEVRYRFMIETCGITDFSYLTLSFPLIINYIALLQSAAIEYERVNGQPLRDENGAIISF
ncbi:DUF4843 domain-containing protein [Sphingobacterium oryzagri]|uniref:DUF4843 domain-containing protein n=1 Tax=Sphingobacterium oryzagri TaxID=3025669 RepID=A0ABY7WFK6_9SPHI|nr:DUF4843 domain-containing protein [Sphingobacterium sp. KACC 22765]WDF68401.1 DUF4843 domain-containing protein [Sphingobacterium sp. KACC 22765]